MASAGLLGTTSLSDTTMLSSTADGDGWLAYMDLTDSRLEQLGAKANRNQRHGVVGVYRDLLRGIYWPMAKETQKSNSLLVNRRTLLSIFVKMCPQYVTVCLSPVFVVGSRHQLLVAFWSLVIELYRQSGHGFLCTQTCLKSNSELSCSQLHAQFCLSIDMCPCTHFPRVRLRTNNHTSFQHHDGAFTERYCCFSFSFSLVLSSSWFFIAVSTCHIALSSSTSSCGRSSS